MCLAIPGKIVEIFQQDGLKMGKIDYSGLVHQACLECCGDVQPGQYVIVHAGFAISVLDEQDAVASLDHLRRMAEAVQAWKEKHNQDRT